MALTKLGVEHFLRRCLAIKLLELQRRHSLLTGKIQLSAETVLTKKNRESCIRKLKLYPAMKVTEEARMAAVLVPLCSYRGELGLLYTLRSSKLNSSGGQVSFPGGMNDDADENLQATALRETWEELRIPESKVEVWSPMNAIGRRNMSVMPVFGYIGDVEPDSLSINRDEVEEAFVISLQSLCDPIHFRYTQFRSGPPLPVYTGGRYRVWGLTGAITHLVMGALVPSTYKNELNILPKVGETTNSYRPNIANK